ncbi:MAG: myo-inosose-2 dehydratase [Alphaproteobacteria bacterium]|nr:myo-inosose-2 dehydratase [Alphaproteobacteria bacterium]
MAIRIGANPIAWSNDDLPEIGGATPLATCLAEASAAGFAGMELGHKFPREPAALKAALAPFGLACIGGWYSLSLLTRSAAAELVAAQAHVDLLLAMGATVFIAAETSNAIHGDPAVPLSRRPRLAAGDWAGYGARLTALADRLLARGLRLVYHHHMGTIVESAADIDVLMAATGPAVGLLLDSGHAVFAGADPVALARRHRRRIAHLHAKDARAPALHGARAGDWSFLDAVLGPGDELGVFTVPGDGMVDFAAIFKELPGYDGWVVVEAEQDPSKAPPLAYAKKGFAQVRQALQQAGLA